MSITAKELATKLNLSATAVSMALNNKPGVSTETRQLVISEAERLGYDFSKLSMKKNQSGDIYCVIYRSSNAILNYSPIFSELTDGIETECRKNGYKLKTLQICEKIDDVQKSIEDFRVNGCIGIILLGTEISEILCRQFTQLPIPIVLLDAYFDSIECSSVLINNFQGAYIATNYLIDRCGRQPGYLCSSYKINNFVERKHGFNLAVQEHGMSIGRSVIHELSPSLEGAMTDMLEIIDRKDNLAECYFADNDLIAIGAIKAFKLRGYKLPDEIKIIGFDNILESRIIEPSLTTISIPRRFMGQTAVAHLIEKINTTIPYTLKIQVSTSLVKRFST